MMMWWWLILSFVFSVVLQYDLCRAELARPSSSISLSIYGPSASRTGSIQRKWSEPLSTTIERPNYEARTWSDFVTRDSRLGFIRKVYAIFGVQMLTTMAVTYKIMADANIARFLYENYQPISIGSLVASTGIVLGLVTNPELRHRPPWNFVLLGLHTLLQSVMVGTFSSLFDPRSVCLGTLHTFAAFAAIALYTLQPNPHFDVTVLGGALLTTLTSLVVGSILGSFFHLPLYDNLLSGALAVVFATYLFHDLQQIVGGKHRKYQYGQKEYILAALNLYQDAIGLYMQVMKLLGERDRRKREG